MNFTNLKIGQRLYLGFGLVLALLVLLAGLAVNSLREASLDEQRLVAMKNRAALADEWVASTRLNINRVMGLAKSGNHPEVDAHFKPLIAQTTERINVLQQELESVIESEQGKALLTEIGAKRKAYVGTRKTYFETLTSGDTARADELLRTGLLPAVEAYLGAMQQLQTYEHELVKAEVAHAQQTIARQQGITMGLAALAILVGLFVAWRVARSVITPLHEAVDVARTVARGDLARRVGSQRRDELGDLLNALEEMRNALVATVSQVRQASDSIGVASSQIASGNQDLSARTEQTASNLQETAASMEELTSTVRNSADAARQANQLASSASEVAVRGGQVVSQVVSTMQEIHHSSQKISDIIGTIDGIAFQTNILALNAAVEAARAGEQGRGFAVVAGEVRNLAQRSAEAAKEIKGLIGASVDRVDVGTKLVADAGQTMSEIVGSIQRVSDIVGEITAAAGEQSDGIGQVNVAVNQLDQMTQQNAALVEESAAAAQSLKDQAQRLAQVVAVFRVDANVSAPAHSIVQNPTHNPKHHAASASPTLRAAPVHHSPAKLPAAAPKAGAALPKPAAAPKAAAPVAPVAPAKPVPVSASAEGDWESF